MNVEFIGLTLDVIGKIMVSYTAIMIHYRVWQEHQIDGRVFAEMKREWYVGITGIILIILGYLLEASALL